MIIQLANIISGFILALPKIAEIGGRERFALVRTKILPYQKMIGVIELLLGVIALIERIGLLPFYIPDLGSSYPQAIPAILAGLLLASTYFENKPSLANFINQLKPFAIWIGLFTLLAGIVSIFFGCPFCGY